MKKIINGRLYNTETATAVASDSYGYPGDFSYWSETLYKKKTGELFLYGEGGPYSKYSQEHGDNSWGGGSAIIPESDFNAKEWVAGHSDADTFIELFGPVDE